MQVAIMMVEQEIKEAIVTYINSKYGVTIDATFLHIEVKSKQNYRSEWEKAAIRVNASIPAKED